VIFVAGFCSPLLVPLVARTSLPAAWKTTLSGLLLLGIPELFTLIAAAVLGKQGFDYLKGHIKRAFGRFFKKHGPPEAVSRRRYRIGLVMFTVPIVLGWMTPYAFHHLPGYEEYRLLYGLSGDVLLIASVFVLGGEFWDKLRSLFVHGARAQFPAMGDGS
jgi:hypothetical protein